jgi:SAM-dependent methyltransferase
VSFDVPPSAYDRFMGRFSVPLAAEFIELIGVRRTQWVLEVGCGTGALTALLVDRVGVDGVSAVDPSESFVNAVLEKYPAMDVRVAAAEDLPFPDGTFDAVVAQLVVHFMADPVRGISEMARCALSDGLIAASVWDHAGGKGPLSTFWTAARSLNPSAPDESAMPGVAEGQLAELFSAAGLRNVESSSLTVEVEHESFNDWWDPFRLGVGPAGKYVEGLDDAGRDALRNRCLEELGHGPFTTSATAWVATGHT